MRFAAQGQLQEVLLNACLNGFAEFILDLEEAISRTQAVDALVGTLVVVVFNPETNARACVLETGELGARQKLLPERLPEALDLAQRHGMLRTTLEMRHAVLLQLRFEARGAPPGSVLPAVIGEHLLGRLILGDRLAIHFDHRLGRRAAKQIRTDNEARVIIQERDHVSVTAAQPEGEDVRLPHLIGRSALEEPGPGHVALARWRRRRDQVGCMKFLTHRLGAGLEEEHTPQPLRDRFNAPGWMLLLELHDPVGDRLSQACSPSPVRRGSLQALLTEGLITPSPIRDRVNPQTELLGNGRLAETLFEVELHGTQLEFEGITLAG